MVCAAAAVDTQPSNMVPYTYIDADFFTNAISRCRITKVFNPIWMTREILPTAFVRKEALTLSPPFRSPNAPETQPCRDC